MILKIILRGLRIIKQADNTIECKVEAAAPVVKFETRYTEDRPVQHRGEAHIDCHGRIVQ